MAKQQPKLITQRLFIKAAFLEDQLDPIFKKMVLHPGSSELIEVEKVEKISEANSTDNTTHVEPA